MNGSQNQMMREHIETGARIRESRLLPDPD
jgi:hypothetical protein